MSLTNQDEVLLLHNPRCSKSRATVELLTAKGIAYRERNYLEDPLSRAELDELVTLLGRRPLEFVRRGESAFAAAGLDGQSSDDAILAALAKAPILLERPIVVRGAAARIGRPPTAVLELFEDQES